MSNVGRGRAGFTLVELLVVIAVIGVLVGLTLPAVQSAREASRRVGCLNNLKQAGLAFHSYATSADAFPIGYVAWGGSSGGGVAPGWSWAVAVLPQMEQGPAYQALNLNLPVDDASNDTVRSATLAVYTCPSDPGKGTFSSSSSVRAGTFDSATTAFAGNAGDGSSTGNGLFRRNKSVRPRDVRDGLSMTFAAGEHIASGARSAWAGVLSNGSGESQAIVTADKPTGGGSSFGGPHSGLIHFLMADGSARPIKTGINPATYRALATRNGREAIDQNSY